MNRFALFCAALTATSGLSFPALAVDKLYSPYVEKGEWEAEYFGAVSFDGNNEKDDAQKHEFSVGYGVNNWWKTELYGNFEKDPQDNIKFDAVEWENIFQLTQKNEYWLDVGASLAYEWTPESSRSDAIEGRLILAKNLSTTTHILNLIAEKDVGSGERDDLQGGLIWSSRYNYSSRFQPGFEISSDFGELNHTGSFDEQEHYVGPTAYGKLPLPFSNESDEGVKYRVGYMFGVSDSASDGQLLAQLEFEF